VPIVVQRLAVEPVGFAFLTRSGQVGFASLVQSRLPGFRSGPPLTKLSIVGQTSLPTGVHWRRAA
jgi:hypothetical protein